MHARDPAGNVDGSPASRTFTVLIVSDTEIIGSNLTLNDNTDTAKRKLIEKSKDLAITMGLGNNSGDDPVLQGGSLRVVSAAGGFDNTYPMPASNWVRIGAAGLNKGYKYKDAHMLLGPVTTAQMKPGANPTKPGQLSFNGKGSGLGSDLALNPNPVSVVATIGGQRFCATSAGPRRSRWIRSSRARTPRPG